MSEKRQVFQIPTQEIYLSGTDTEIEVGRLAVIGFVNEEFVLPESYRSIETETKGWPILLLDMTDESLSAHPQAYRLVPDYSRQSSRWRLHHGWDTFVQYDSGEPKLWSGSEDTYFWKSPRAYDQKKLQLAINVVMNRPWMY